MTDLIPLINAIDELLPQTQCTKCGYQGCRPYADAIAHGDAINKCPPGGQAGVEQLAALLQRPAMPLDTSHGETPAALLVAFIREPECIGCTKCIQVCPVDAILGAAKLMHTVISDICTGCDLCVAACPVDCIDMVAAVDQQPSAADSQRKKDLSRQRFNQRNHRLQQLADARTARKQTRVAFHEQTEGNSSEQRNAAVLAALAALQEKSAQRPVDEQRTKLEKALAAARERLERADAKVREAAAKGSDQLAQLQARREDMRFKVEETQRKLAALAAAPPQDAAPPATANEAAAAAVANMLAARSRQSDQQRLARALGTLEASLSDLQQQLLQAGAEEAHLLRDTIERLEQKRTRLLADAILFDSDIKI